MSIILARKWCLRVLNKCLEYNIYLYLTRYNISTWVCSWYCYVFRLLDQREGVVFGISVFQGTVRGYYIGLCFVSDCCLDD